MQLNKKIAHIVRAVICLITRKMVPIKKRAGIIPYIFYSGLALLSSLLSYSFYLLDQRTISGVDLLEMTWKDGIVVLCPYHGHLPGL